MRRLTACLAPVIAPAESAAEADTEIDAALAADCFQAILNCAATAATLQPIRKTASTRLPSRNKSPVTDGRNTYNATMVTICYWGVFACVILSHVGRGAGISNGTARISSVFVKAFPQNKLFINQWGKAKAIRVMAPFQRQGPRRAYLFLWNGLSR